MEYYAGIDLGGTNIKCGIVDETGKGVGRNRTERYTRDGAKDRH